MKKYKAPYNRHYPRKASYHKRLNTMICVPKEEILKDVDEINRCDYVCREGEVITTSSGRKYGTEKPKNHWRLYPISGPGLVTIDAAQYKALRMFVKQGADAGLEYLIGLLENSEKTGFTDEKADTVVDLAVYAGVN